MTQLDAQDSQSAAQQEGTALRWRISQPAHLLGALRVSLAQGGRYLEQRITPNGPILAERNLSYIHKASWGMYEAGVCHDTIAGMLVGPSARPCSRMATFTSHRKTPATKICSASTGR